MSELVVETSALSKRYGGRVAVADLDLAVPAGQVHGFLGPNGSGKTTTIRMLLGLSRATSGTMRLFGRPVPDELPAVIGRVGAVVESPKFSPGLTGRQNLQLLGRVLSVSQARIDAAVETVGLTGRDRDRYRSYSLGMKQRLAVAATLLKDPALLILDEPTNGLDPAGISEIRETILRLSQAGVTVLLSSHILVEVEAVCSAVTIIGRGRTLASGPLADLVGHTTAYVVAVPDPYAARRVLVDAGLTLVPGPILTVATDDPAAITRLLAGAGIWLTGLTAVRAGLESVYLELTHGQGREA